MSGSSVSTFCTATGRWRRAASCLASDSAESRPACFAKVAASRNPTSVGGTYQLGRALFLKGLTKEATEKLADAMIFNGEHALHACGDPDLLAKMDILGDALRLAHEGCAARYQQVADRFRRARQALGDYSFMDKSLATMPLKGLAPIHELTKTAAKLAESNTLFGFSAAINQLLMGFQLFSVCFEEFKGHCVRILEKKVTQPPRRESYVPANYVEGAKGPPASRLGILSGLVSGVGVFLFESSQTVGPIYRGLLESKSELVLIPVASAVGIAAAVVFSQDLYREFQRTKHQAALAAYEAARHGHNVLKNSLEKQIGDVRNMRLPREFLPLSFGASSAKPATSASQPQAQRRVSAWDKLGEKV